jgi:hypothetical protein
MNADPVEQSNEHQDGEPSNEEELRAAYEAEMSRISSADMILQAAVSLLNIGGYRLGLSPGRDQPPGAARDLEQVRDAIDGVRALLPILERRRPEELRPLRDALSQLQMAYAREAGTSASAEPAAGAQARGAAAKPDAPVAGSQPGEPGQAGQPGGPGAKPQGPGPAESSGRLWVPGR